ncbi:MAG: hypothetical protein BAA02_02705 [Paenibacillaceae bacterium ZCTH02-B3]|nr:MAG: hypothetical protein BAA02_02705 [Paenibacillaceae bacterium ZCTH02-B3]
MAQPDKVTTVAETGAHLGIVVCKYCHEVLYTLPSRKVKIVYGVCDRGCASPNRVEDETE